MEKKRGHNMHVSMLSNFLEWRCSFPNKTGLPGGSLRSAFLCFVKFKERRGEHFQAFHPLDTNCNVGKSTI